MRTRQCKPCVWPHHMTLPMSNELSRLTRSSSYAEGNLKQSADFRAIGTPSSRHVQADRKSDCITPS